MNSKKCKLLRQIAKKIISQAAVETDVNLFETRYTEITARRKKMKTDEGKTIEISTGTIQLDPRCYKGTYKALKKSN